MHLEICWEALRSLHSEAVSDGHTIYCGYTFVIRNPWTYITKLHSYTSIIRDCFHISYRDYNFYAYVDFIEYIYYTKLPIVISSKM